jgi:hypothetical protein
VQLTMTTEGADLRGNLFVRKCIDWSHCRLHYTRIDHRYQVLLAAYYNAEKRKHTSILSFCFLAIFDAYYILFKAISLSFFYLLSIFAPLPPNFGALGDRLVCLLVKQ